MTGAPAITVQTTAQLSAHLKALRRARGLTQAQLGQLIGVRQARVADIERHPGAISVEQLLQILHALGARWLLADAAGPASRSSAAHRAGEPEPRW